MKLSIIPNIEKSYCELFTNACNSNYAHIMMFFETLRNKASRVSIFNVATETLYTWCMLYKINNPECEDDNFKLQDNAIFLSDAKSELYKQNPKTIKTGSSYDMRIKISKILKIPYVDVLQNTIRKYTVDLEESDQMRVIQFATRNLIETILPYPMDLDSVQEYLLDHKDQFLR